MKEIDFINSLCAMRKTRLVSIWFHSSYWWNAPLIRLHCPVSWTSSKSSLRTITSIHWFSLLSFWMNSKPLLSPCMLLGSSSKVNTLSLELHQPTDSLFLLAFWMNSKLHLPPCMLLGSSSKVNTLSLELHQPTSLLFLLKHQSRTFASDFSNLTESHKAVTIEFFLWSTWS